MKSKFFPGGQEKERGTFLSPTSRSSRRSAHNGGTSPLDFSSKVNFAPPVPGAPFSRPLGLHYFGFSVLLVLLVFSLDFGYRSRSFLLFDIALCGGVTSTIPCTARSGEQKFLCCGHYQRVVLSREIFIVIAELCMGFLVKARPVVPVFTCGVLVARPNRMRERVALQVVC